MGRASSHKAPKILRSHSQRRATSSRSSGPGPSLGEPCPGRPLLAAPPLRAAMAGQCRRALPYRGTTHSYRRGPPRAYCELSVKVVEASQVGRIQRGITRMRKDRFRWRFVRARASTSAVRREVFVEVSCVATTCHQVNVTWRARKMNYARWQFMAPLQRTSAPERCRAVCYYGPPL